jgi:hypothetical protein
MRLCACGCNRHHLNSIVATKNGRKLWFLTLDCLDRWEASQCTTA